MSIRSQPDGEETRDTLAAIGLFGFVLVPVTAVATTLWRNRHPVILRESGETGVDLEIKQLMGLEHSLSCALYWASIAELLDILAKKGIGGRK